jgi:hypothetical protein
LELQVLSHYSGELFLTRLLKVLLKLSLKVSLKKFDALNLQTFSFPVAGKGAPASKPAQRKAESRGQSPLARAWAGARPSGQSKRGAIAREIRPVVVVDDYPRSFDWGGKENNLGCLGPASGAVGLGAFAGNPVAVQSGFGNQIERVRRKPKLMLRDRQAASVAFHSVY